MTRTPKLLVLVGALLALGAAACGRYLEAGAAVVDGKEISKKDLDARVAAVAKGQAGQGLPGDQLTREVLKQLIQDALVSREAARRGIKIGEDDVAAQLRSIRQRFQSEPEFQQALASQGLDLDTLRERLRNQAAIERIQGELTAVIKVTDAEVRQAYGDGSRYEEIKVSHILFSVQQGGNDAAALKKARDALAKIRGGADFAALAKQLSDDPGSKAQGGALGQAITRDSQIVPEFLTAAFKLKTGQVSEPVKTQFGYHLIKVTSRRKPTFDAKREEIRRTLSEERGRDAFQGFISDLVRRANIVVNPRYGDFDAESFSIVDHKFFEPASPEPVPGGIPGLSLPQG